MEAFEGDKLNRKKEAIEVTDYLINRYTVKQDAFVLNLDADWGFGKTYFLQNWQKYLESERKCKVIYFNAWKHDFSQDPLISFMTSVENQLSQYINLKGETQSYWRKMRDEALPFLAGAITKKVVGASIDEIKEVFESDEEQPEGETEEEKANNSESELAKVTSALSAKATKLALAEQKQIEKQIHKFTENLEKLSKNINDANVPLFIFIDELDRCRPSFAIQLLEVIKHLFSAKGVYFVIATASGQLSEAIKAVYGQGFDGAKYLNRFFDQTYHFVSPDTSNFASLLFNENPAIFENFDSFIIDVPWDKNGAGILVSEIANWLNAGLRDIKQSYSIMECIALSNRKKRFVTLSLSLLCLAKVSQPEVYEELKVILDPERKDYGGLEDAPEFKKLIKGINPHKRLIKGFEQDIFMESLLVLIAWNEGNVTPHTNPNSVSLQFKSKIRHYKNEYYPVNKYFELIESAARFKSNA
ncbi:KAP family P-loop domain protein [Pseudoalteromonas sp. P1-9]|uniref:KAP family P-loop NTPase fold protein n=1 Tax=Pseudoalteromonas sp. P1-9 TaxID=1710354 RepID=UPI0006D64D97|nr:P-loop NTPase fold protein [Pseudoalteromonas sp. P1-9]KPV93934.1 KAP family P-loop domain protein [Pseudoalteromonas sp. P1-9]